MKIYAAKRLDPNTIKFPYGYPIHARCWDLIERIFGAEAERHLECLLHALQERWADSDFRITVPSNLYSQRRQPKWTKKRFLFMIL